MTIAIHPLSLVQIQIITDNWCITQEQQVSQLNLLVSPSSLNRSVSPSFVARSPSPPPHIQSPRQRTRTSSYLVQCSINALQTLALYWVPKFVPKSRNSGSEIVNKAIKDNFPPTAPTDHLPQHASLVCGANRHRQGDRSRNPQDLDFEVQNSAIPDDFLRGDIQVGQK